MKICVAWTSVGVTIKLIINTNSKLKKIPVLKYQGNRYYDSNRIDNPEG